MLDKPIISLFFFEKEPTMITEISSLLENKRFNLSKDNDFFFTEDANEILLTYKNNLHQKNSSLVFISLQMPGSLDLMKEIKALDDDAFIIAYSSDASEDKVLGAKVHGAQGFIVKPFTADIMEKYIQRYFQNMIQKANQKHFESVKNRLRWTI